MPLYNNHTLEQLPPSIKEAVSNLSGAWQELNYNTARGKSEARHYQRVKDAKQHLINVLNKDVL